MGDRHGEGRESSENEEAEGSLGQAPEDEVHPYLQDANEGDVAPRCGDRSAIEEDILRSCHQCRNSRHPCMKCCAIKENGKRCPLHYCRRCLSSRHVPATSLLNSWLTSLNCAALGTLRSLLYKMASLYVRDARKLAIASLAQRDVMSLTSRLGEYLTGLINRGFGLHQAEALIGGQHR